MRRGGHYAMTDPLAIGLHGFEADPDVHVMTSDTGWSGWFE